MASTSSSRTGSPSLGVYQFVNTLRRDVRLRLALGCLVMVVSIIVADRLWGIDLRNRTAPAGLLTFEVSNDPFVSKAIVSSWDGTEQLYAAYCLGLSFVLWLFIVVGMVAGCLWAAEEMRFTGRTMVRVGRGLAWLQLAAGVLHIAGTVTLIEVMIDVAAGDSLLSLDRPITIAWYCGLFKYSILSSGVLYLATVPIARAVRPGDGRLDSRDVKGIVVNQ